MEKKLQRILAQYKGKRDEIVPILLNIQEKIRYIPKKMLPEVARFTHTPASKVFSVATFYDRFHLEPQGKYRIQICSGTACYVNGKCRILEAIKHKLGIVPGQTTKNRQFSLEDVACFGLCTSGPIMAVNNKIFSRMTPQKAEKIINDFKRRKKKSG